MKLLYYLLALGCWMIASPLWGADPLPFRIERTTILTGPEKFYDTQARAALVPGTPERMVLTTQLTEKVGSHGYRDLYQIESRDHGQTWSTPTPIENLRRQQLPNGDDFVIGVGPI